MERSEFIGRIAGRLGRQPLTTAPARDVQGAPEFYVARPYGTDETVDRAERFAQELKALGGEAILVGGFAEAGEALRTTLADLKATKVVTWDRAEFEAWNIDWLWDDLEAVSWSDSEDAVEIAAAADAGITLATFGIANTGTLVLETTAATPRSVSLLPTTHIALLRESQIVDRMGQALETFHRWPVADVPSSIHFISGPSRSSDIENDLTIGVHGPVAVIVVLVRDLSTQLA
jgi:L-lactate dehydrogenase complex protein LldG